MGYVIFVHEVGNMLKKYKLCRVQYNFTIFLPRPLSAGQDVVNRWHLDITQNIACMNHNIT